MSEVILPPIEPVPDKKTIRSILRNWFLSRIENKPEEFIWFWIKFFFAFCIFLTTLFFNTVVNIVIQFFTFNEYIVTKLIVSFIIVWNCKRVYSKIKKLLKPKDDEKPELFCEMPLDEVLNYLFRNKTFQMKDICEAFKIKKYKWEYAVSLLKKEKILIKDKLNYNRYILNEEYSRQDIAHIVSSFIRTKKFTPFLLLFNWIGHLSPTKKKITEQLKQQLHEEPLPVFTVRKVK
jgi:hypothetical protein